MTAPERPGGPALEPASGRGPSSETGASPWGTAGARRALTLGICCLSLFIFRATVSPGSAAQTFSPFLLASQARITAVR